MTKETPDMTAKKRLFLLHTMPFVMDEIIGPLERDFLEEHPDVEIQTMLDTSLLADTMADGRVSGVTGARLLTYVQQAERAGADMLLLTCTSMGAGLAHVGEFSDLPTLAITEPMMKQALDLGTRIGIIGTVATSPAQIIEPLLVEAERRGLGPDDLTLVVEVVEGAFAARGRGDTAAHDRLVSEAVARMAGENEIDAILFAQASMSGTAYGDPGVPVLTLGASAFEAAGEMLAGM
jgi:Asp/Glu/hydantoin racemase